MSTSSTTPPAAIRLTHASRVGKEVFPNVAGGPPCVAAELWSGFGDTPLGPACLMAELCCASSLLTWLLRCVGVKSVDVVIGVKVSWCPACRYRKRGPAAEEPAARPELRPPAAAGAARGAAAPQLGEEDEDELPTC